MAHNWRTFLLGVGMGIMLVFGIEVGIALITGNRVYFPYLPRYPHAIVYTRTIVEETDPNDTLRMGVLLHRTTTFTTRDSPDAIRPFYHQLWDEYDCKQEPNVEHQGDLAFRCGKIQNIWRSEEYLITMTIAPIDGQINQVTIQQLRMAKWGL